MPSDDRVRSALSAVAPQLTAFRSVAIGALEHARAVLAPAGGVDRLRLELGALGARIDAARLASVSRQRCAKARALAALSPGEAAAIAALACASSFCSSSHSSGLEPPVPRWSTRITLRFFSTSRNAGATCG